MLNFILGGAGSGKSTLMTEKIKKELSEGNKLCIIIPDQFSFNYDSKLYNVLGAEKFNNVSTISFIRLAEDIFRNFGGRSGEYADDMTKLIIMYQTIQKLREKKSLMFFDKQAKYSTFVETAIDIVSEIRKAGVTPDLLITKTEYVDGQIRDKIKDISVIYSEYDNQLAEMGFIDSLADISEASRIANLNNYFENTVVIIDEFESFSGDEYEMINTIIAQAEDVYIALRTEEPFASDFSIFDTVNKTFKSLSAIANSYGVERNINMLNTSLRYRYEDIKHISKNILRNHRTQIDKSENIQIIEAKDLYDEVEFVCAEIRQLVVKQGYKFKEIAVVSRQLDDYVNIFQSAFERYEIPYFMDMQRPVMHTAIMLLITGVLEIADAKTPDTETILRYAKTQLLGIKYEKISLLENYCYKWNVTGDMWLNPFTIEIKDEDNEIELLRQQIINPVLAFKNKCEDSAGLQICKALYEFLEQVGVSTNISGMSMDYNRQGYTDFAKELRQLWDDFINILDTLANVLNDTQISISEFKNLLTTMLKQNSYALPPQTLDTITVASAERTRLNAPKVTFIVGVNEGIFPYNVKSNGLLNDNDKLILEKAGIEISKNQKDIIANERLITYITFASPSEKLYISYTLANSGGESMFPSYVVSQAEKLFTNPIKKYTKDFSPSYYASTLYSAYYTHVQDFNCSHSEQYEIERVLRENPFYNSKLDYLKSVNQHLDFKVEKKELMRSLFSNRFKIPATKVEEYNQCHFKFFCANGLQLYPRTKKEINPLQQGHIIHYCLEKLLINHQDKIEFESLEREQISAEIGVYANEYKEKELGGSYGKTKRFEANYKHIIENMTELVIHLQEEFKQSTFRPVNFELVISEQQGNKPITLTTENGIEIILTGKVDRVDMYEENGQKYIRVIDYKTGKRLFSLTNLIYGIDMQMVLYLFSLTENKGLYSGAKPAGVLYMPSGGLKCEREKSQTVENYKNSKYKMKGVVLQNRSVLNAMEDMVKGVYIPASLLKADKGDGELKLSSASTFLNENQFEGLRSYAKGMLIKMTESLYDGDISANPLGTEVCKYCDYWDICGNVPNIRCREMVANKETVEEFKRELEGKENEQ